MAFVVDSDNGYADQRYGDRVALDVPRDLRFHGTLCGWWLVGRPSNERTSPFGCIAGGLDWLLSHYEFCVLADDV